MAIYAYRCTNCGVEKEVIQKMSDAPLSVCPACGQATFAKQVTAAGFQLKGSGWYVTDFRGGNTAAPAAAATTTATETATENSPAIPAATAPVAAAPAATPASSTGT